MNYKHKWVNDKSRYAVVLKVGSGSYVSSEYENEKELHERLSSLVCCDGPPFFDIQRYTDQQMELEAQGWTLFEMGCGEISLSHHTDLHIDVCTADGNTFHFTPDNRVLFSRTSSSPDCVTVAWRLSNEDGYKDGVKVVNPLNGIMAGPDMYHKINSKTEWKAGELITGIPPLNVEIEFKNVDVELHDWEPVTILLIQGNRFWGKGFTQLINLDSCNYRPIQSERDKVIAKALDVAGFAAADCVDVDVMEKMRKLYDAGMLSMPDKGEE